MKKIVGILGMAAVLGSAAFAADPAANFVLADFTGSAEFGFKSELQSDVDAKFGMYNNNAAGIKFGFTTAGDKVTTGDGVWGELKISTAATNAAATPAAAVDTAKIHLVNGDFSMALNILKPSVEYAGFTPMTAAPAFAIETKAAGTVFKDMKKKLEDGIKARKDDIAAKEKAAKEKTGTADYVLALADVKTAKEKADIEFNGEKIDLATAEAYLKLLPGESASAATTLGTSGLAKDHNKDYTAGFGLNVAMDNMFNLNVNFVDNGFINKDDATKKNTAKDKKYALGADLAITAVEGLTARLAQVTEFNKDGLSYFGLQALAGYEFKLDDKMYVNPSVAFETTKAGKDADNVNVLAAGLMFGWGAKGVGPTMDFFNDDPAAPKTFNEGVSFAIFPSLAKDTTSVTMNISIYDQSLFSLLGLEDFGVLKTAFGYDANIGKNLTMNTIAFATAYDVTFSPVYFGLHFGIKGSVTSAEGSKYEPDYKFGVKLGSKEIIDNTDVFVGYELAGAFKENNKPVSTINVGTKISF